MLNAVVSPLPPVWLLQLLDLCVLHMNSLDFQYRVLAASVLSHFIQQEAVEKVTGKSWDYHVYRNVNMNLKNMFNVWFHGLTHSEVTWLTSWKHAYIYIYIYLYIFFLCVQVCRKTQSSRVLTGWLLLWSRWAASAERCLRILSKWRQKTNTISRHTQTTWPCWLVFSCPTCWDFTLHWTEWWFFG